MARISIEQQLDQLRELRVSANKDDECEALSAKLRPFLEHGNNLVVARSADLAREMNARQLLPELTTAFERFLAAAQTETAAKSDPQCWAKNALSKALHHLGYDRAPLFLQGLTVHQLEPVWGGQSDVAGTLRANCAHALIDCHELTHHALLLHLLPSLADKDKSVRAEATRAIAQAGGDSVLLLLRLRALTPGGEDPCVIGQCYAGLLALEGVAAVPFVAQFLKVQDEYGAEAAVALGETRTPEALSALLACLQAPAKLDGPTRSRIRRPEAQFEPEFASVLLSAIALTRQEAAIQRLLDLVAAESGYAEAAIEALANAGFGLEVQQRLSAIVEKVDSARITRIHAQYFAG